MKYINKLEEEKIQEFVKDEVMFEAVKKVLLAGIYQNGTLTAGQPAEPMINGALAPITIAFRSGDIDTKKIGENLLAYYYGVSSVEEGFNHLASMKKLEEVKEETENPAE